MGSTDGLLFSNLDADEQETTAIESLCMNCGENGITRLLLTKIPFYKDVIIMSFKCEECGYENNEIQSGGQIKEKGIRIVLRVETEDDLNRTLVKSDYTSVNIPEVELEIPANTQKGEVTTVEGVINRTITGLQQDQEIRRNEHPDAAAQIDEYCNKLEKLKSIENPFNMIIEDISGNCFLTNPRAPQKDLRVEEKLFVRNKQQDHALGIYTNDELQEDDKQKEVLMAPEENFVYEDLHSEVFTLPSNCPACNAPCVMNTKQTKIPYFKEVLIMATNCDACGYRSNEVKSGCGIEDKGIRIEVNITDVEDLKRDVLKSDTCYLKVPELELEVGPANFGGKFSTVEGLLVNVKEQLQDSANMFSDSAEENRRGKFEDFFKNLDLCIAGQMTFTMVLTDPAGNSYVQSTCPPEPDDKMTVTRFERTYEQNEELGLNDMVVDNYQNNDLESNNMDVEAR